MHDYSRHEARIIATEACEMESKAWLDEEWLPCLQNHRQKLRAEREAEERRSDEVQQALQRERHAMSCEDSASSAFVAFAACECQQRATQMHLVSDPVLQSAITAIVATRTAELKCITDREAHRRQAEASARLQEEQRREWEYQEWKREVRNARCGTMQQPHQGLMNQSETVHQAALENALQRAAADSHRLKESGLSPRRSLEEARKKAVFNQKERELFDPAKADQDLWESMLAKNRHARQQQERSSRTPRWGMFT
jgi:hypothetical protein